MEKNIPLHWESMISLVYTTLYQTAQKTRKKHHLRNSSLDTSAILHEALLSLYKNQGLVVNDEAHFYALSTQAMRYVILNYLRNKRKREAAGTFVALPNELEQIFDELITEDLEFYEQLEEALKILEQVNDRAFRAVNMRYYLGLSPPEIAKALDITERTYHRDMNIAHRLIKSYFREPS